MSQPSNSAVRGSPTSSAAPPPAAATGDFVVNLCASTTPMALAKPTAPELARYTFFVSRRREEGRERFRLHMGYFATREDAEQMLALVRDLYPAAWVGETPGRKLAANAARAAQAQAMAGSSADVAPATPRASSAATAPPVVTAPGVATASPAMPAHTAASVAPPLRPAAPSAAPAAALAPAAPAVATDGDAADTAQMPALKLPAAPPPSVEATASALRSPVAPRPAVDAAAPVARAATPKVGAVPPTARAAAPSRPAMPPASNVREVIAALEPEAAVPSVVTAAPAPQPAVTVPPPVAAAPPRARESLSPPAALPAAPAPAPASVPARAAAPATPSPAASVPAPANPSPVVPAVRSTSPNAEMTDSQVLRVLEGRGSTPQGRAAGEGVRDIAMISPQDTQTWRDIKAQIKRDAVVHFAVQLNWSVSPIDLARVPSLAIFNAYTLYKIEGNREGRKWYGLRLGFFSDAVAAKQVAHYVRSEFAQVAVVPVSVNEREQAKQIGAIALPAAAPVARPSSLANEPFKLIDDDPPPAAAAPTATVTAETPATTRPVGASPAARAPAANRRPNRPRGAPQSLEETLEILGASQLSIDNGRGERVVIDGRARTVDAPTSTFSKLLDRLSDKLRK